MGLLTLFKKPEKKDFCDMSKDERKVFLANDLIERMVRIEQRVRASFGEGAVAYYQTQYFKELRDDEKKRFRRYLETKEKNRKWKLFFLSIVLGFGFFSGLRITGNAIASGGDISILNMVAISLFIIVAIVLAFHAMLKKHRWKKMEGHFNVLENILVNRKSKRK